MHFVDNQTVRLEYLYSILVKQYAISDSAYTYWDQLRTNSSSVGGLYEQQPLPVNGNLYNLTNPDKEVLGFFTVTYVQEKRIFVQNVDNLELDYESCALEEFDFRIGWRGYTEEEYPLYYLLIDQVPWILKGYCHDCRFQDGVLEKPDFWPEE